MVLNGFSQISDDFGSTLTIGTGITIHGSSGTISSFGGTLINQGTIAADVSGGMLTVDPESFENNGTISAANGGALYVSGLTGSLGKVSLSGNGSVLSVDGTNYTVDSSLTIDSGQTLGLTGTWSLGAGVTITVNDASFGLGNPTSLSGISLTNSTLIVEGTDTYADIEPLLAGNNQLAIGPGGVLDNTGTTITLNPTTGNLTLAGGTIDGGTVTASGGAEVVAGPSYESIDGTGASTLDGVTLDSDLNVQDGSSLSVQDGLTLNGVMTLAATSAEAQVDFDGTQNLDGTGQIVFGGGDSFNYVYVQGFGDGATLTIGSDITVDGSQSSYHS